MSQAIDALKETSFFGTAGNPVLPTPVKRPANPAPVPQTRRITTDIAGDLHMRMKLECVRQGISINDMLRDLLATRFPG
jgi:hypothetical protein